MRAALTATEPCGFLRRRRRTFDVGVARWAVTAAWMWATPVGAKEAPPDGRADGSRADPIERLVRRALARAGLDGEGDAEARARRSALWPSLRVGAAVRGADPAARMPSLWEVSAGLAWRFDRALGDEPGLHRQRAERRAVLAERVASLWRSRSLLAAPTGDVEDDVILRLRGDELDGEMEALTGEPPGCEADEACP